MKKNEDLETITGSVENIIYSNEETNFCILKIKQYKAQNLTTIICNTTHIHQGEQVECKGIWIKSKKFGIQFKSLCIKNILPTTIEGIEKYLSLGPIRGIGPHFAKILISSFKDKIFDIIEKTPTLLTTVNGIGIKRSKMIIDSWNEQKHIKNIMIFLQTYGIGTTNSNKIYKTYGDRAINIISNDPYILAKDITGIGFKMSDTIAKKLGFQNDSIIRIKSGIIYILEKAATNGHCALIKDILLKNVSNILSLDEKKINEVLMYSINSKIVIFEKINNIEFIFLPSLYLAELTSANNIKKLQYEKNLPWNQINCEKALIWAEKKTGIILSQSQKYAIEQVLNEKISIITGGPGVGKTTIINTILKIIKAKNVNVSLCAPTGRAAKKLSETTGIHAKTIHRLLNFDPIKKNFKYNNKNNLLTDMIIIDEASMIDIILWNNLIKAISSKTVLLIVGDVNQLPSVGPGYVLSDLILSKIIKVVELTQIFRQSADSQIVTNAHRINNGLFPLIDNKNSDFIFMKAESHTEIINKLVYTIKNWIPNTIKCNKKLDIQILTPMNKGELGCINLNNLLQNELNNNLTPSIKKFGINFSVGDKIIQNINNYEKNVFNGDMGIINHIDINSEEIIVNYYETKVKYKFNELDEISLAYAISIHKSQGSEYPIVIIPITMQHYIFLARNMIYTAITRGKKLVILIGQTKALSIAVNNITTQTRITTLKHKLNSKFI